MKSRLTVPRLSLAILFIAALAGCAAWRVVKDPPAEYVARRKPDVVRLTLADTSMVLSRPQARGDSVVGLGKGIHPRRWTGIPSSEIRGLEIHTTRGTKGTKIAAISITTLFVAFAAAAAAAGGKLR